MRGSTTGCLLAAILLTASAAAAAEESIFGELSTANMVLPPESTALLEPIALLDKDTAESWLTLESSEVMFCEYEQTKVEARTPVETFQIGPTPEPKCRRLTEVTIQPLVGQDHRGWLGMKSLFGATLNFTAGTDTQVGASSKSVLSNRGENTTASDNAPQRPWYYEVTAGAHLRVSGGGLLAHRGPGELKFSGLDVLVSSRELNKEYLTGESSSEGSIRERVIRWSHVTFTDAAIVLRSPGVEITAHEARAELSGNLLLNGATGIIEAASAHHEANGTQIEIDGNVILSAQPILDAQRALVSTHLEGQVQRLAIGTTSISLDGPMFSKSPLRWASILLVGVTVIAAGTFYHTRRRKPFDEDYCMDLADYHEQNGQYTLALKWLLRASALAPTSARVASNEAFVLSMLGRVEDALAAYERAHRLSNDGEAAIAAARLLDELSYPQEAVLPWVAKALERSPALIRDLAPSEFVRLRHLPIWISLIESAKRRLNGREE